MTRQPLNHYLHTGQVASSEAEAFEEGVDAGREWGRAEKDEEWRENIRRLLAAHAEQFVYGGEKIVSVEHIEALL